MHELRPATAKRYRLCAGIRGGEAGESTGRDVLNGSIQRIDGVGLLSDFLQINKILHPEFVPRIQAYNYTQSNLIKISSVSQKTNDYGAGNPTAPLAVARKPAEIFLPR